MSLAERFIVVVLVMLGLLVAAASRMDERAPASQAWTQ